MTIETKHLPVVPAGWSSSGTHLGLALSWLVATVWLYHGLYNKLLGGEPRHLLIVQSVPGLEGAVGWGVLMAVGVAEVVLAAWFVSGFRLRLCAAVQTVLLLGMNVMELSWAWEHLLFPRLLIPVNMVFLGMVWMSAELRLRGGRPRRRAGPGLHMLRRHPFPVRAYFRHSLVLTYALPARVLEPLLPPGLELDRFGECGVLAVAMVQTQRLRPAFLPAAMGQGFVLTGYRVFTRFRTAEGRTLRGLRILRSDTSRRMMVFAGNLLTHYNYHLCEAEVQQRGPLLDVRLITPAGEADVQQRGPLLDVRLITPAGEADVDVTADLSQESAGVLPAGSPFRTVAEARRFAGPLPWTFDYEAQTHSIIAIRGVRENWSPRLVPVEVRRLSFLDRPPFAGHPARLASAFYVHDIPYRWERGIRHPLPGEAP